MEQRMTWEEIKKNYPDQWVGLIEVEYKPDNDASIKSAVVKYTDKTKSELTRMQIQSDGAIEAVYTTPDNICLVGALGAVGVFGG